MELQEIHNLIDKKLGGSISREEERLLDDWYGEEGEQPPFTDRYNETELTYVVGKQFEKFRARVENKKTPIILVVV